MFKYGKFRGVVTKHSSGTVKTLQGSSAHREWILIDTVNLCGITDWRNGEHCVYGAVVIMIRQGGAKTVDVVAHKGV